MSISWITAFLSPWKLLADGQAGSRGGGRSLGMIMLVATLNIFLKDPSELAVFLSVALCYLVSLTCSRLFFLLTAHRLGSLSEGLVFVIFYSELYGRLIHCPADGRNKRKIKLPRSESIQSRINSGEFTSPSETAAAAFSVEDACRHFDGLEVNVGVKGGGRA